MRSSTRSALVLALGSLAVACSSPSDVGDQTSAPLEPCIPVDQAADERASCSFGPGALVEETVGQCATGTGKVHIPVEHIVLLMQENRSFDHYLGELDKFYPDADVAPKDASNPNASGTGDVPYHKLEDYCFIDTPHSWTASHKQWNEGKQDGFAQAAAHDGDFLPDPEGTRAMGYYGVDDIPFAYQLASTFATSDSFFCDVMGPTWPNRMYFYSGSSFGVTTNAPAPRGTKPIWDLLDEHGITWRIYRSNLLTAAMFLDWAFEHQEDDRIRPASQFAIDAANGDLAQVNWVDPVFSRDGALETSEHPPAVMQIGQKWLYDQVQTVMRSPLWPKTAMFITYDEHGGLYDHVPPPPACPPDDIAPVSGAEYGGFDKYGFRVPIYVVSPFSKAHHLSHKTYSNASILRFVQVTFGLPALTRRDANADPMLDMFDFENPPFLTPPKLDEPPIDQAKLDVCKQLFPK